MPLTDAAQQETELLCGPWYNRELQQEVACSLASVLLHIELPGTLLLTEAHCLRLDENKEANLTSN